MQIKENYDLTGFNTFGVKARAKFFAEVENELDLQELFAFREFKDNDKLFLGGGSNVLFTKDFDGIVVLNKLKGVEILEEDGDSVLIKCMSGEVWHDIVLLTVSRGYWGIENLSLIPGTVGAAPMQNIGAYGAELKDTLVDIEAYEVATGEKKIFKNEECELGYRDSVFKNRLKGKYFILSITLKLSKTPTPNISYKILQEHLEKNNIAPDSSKKISDAVTNIRRSKLPDPKDIGNAGSFFKNVFVSQAEFEQLQNSYPEIPFFEEDGSKKIPAGWLIEQCGPANGTSWKGYREGMVGVHERQALVIVNYGGAKGEEIKNLAERIIYSVHAKFGLNLTPEVNMI